jgi:hypothetical protein
MCSRDAVESDVGVQASEQFYVMCCLASWLLGMLGVNLQPPQRFDDPNASVSQLMGAQRCQNDPHTS